MAIAGLVDPITQQGPTDVTSWLPSRFTFSAKRMAESMAPTRKRGIASGLLLLALVEPAAAGSRIGQTSEAEIRISVSVAPRFGLGNGSLESRPDGAATHFCLVANGRPIHLRVFLVRPAPDQPALAPGSQRSTELALCGPDGQMASTATAPFDAGAVAMVLIRPE